MPEEFQGAWQRTGLWVDGRTVEDRCLVVWLQSGEWYVDVRAPLLGDAAAPAGSGAFGRRWAFAGTATWEPPSYTWRHTLDSDAPALPDVGELTWDGPTLVETGTSAEDGRKVLYTEHWSRLVTADAPIHHVTAAKTVVVTVGDWRATAHEGRPQSSFLGRLERRSGRDWHTVSEMVVEP